jgi:hypothetical protein
MAGLAMARPKKPRDQKTRGNPPEGYRTIGVRASNEWAKWCEGAARHFRTRTVAGLIDRALAEWAEAKGYPAPPERVP